MRLFKTSSKLTSLKNGCLLISSASVLPDPSRRTGSRVSNYKNVSRSVANHASTHLLQDRHGIPGHRDGVERLIFEDGVEDFVLVVTAEGGLPEKHLVHQHTKRPPIDGSAVTLFEEDLRYMIVFEYQKPHNNGKCHRPLVP